MFYFHYHNTAGLTACIIYKQKVKHVIQIYLTKEEKVWDNVEAVDILEEEKASVAIMDIPTATLMNVEARNM